MRPQLEGVWRRAPMKQGRTGSAARIGRHGSDTLSRTAGKNLECGDLSPLLLLWRLVCV